MTNTQLPPEVIPLWSDDIPQTDIQSTTEQETIIASPRFNNLVKNMKVVRNVAQPSLLAYLPDSSIANGTAVIICPGGGFSALPIEIEGADVARWLNAKGV